MDLSNADDFNKFIINNNIDLPDAFNFIKSLDKPSIDLTIKEIDNRIKYLHLIIKFVREENMQLYQPTNLDPNFVKNVLLRQLYLNLKEAKDAKYEKEDWIVGKILLLLLLLSIIGYLCYYLYTNKK